jgi:hypothetical protein
MPARAEELRTKLAAWRQALAAEMPAMKTAAERERERAAPAATSENVGRKGKRSAAND